MRKYILVLLFICTIPVGATTFDVIYRFDRADNDDYFTIKVDFDYVQGDSPFVFGTEVFSYEEFVDVANNGDDLPVFYFDIELIDTNMPLQPLGSALGTTLLIANEIPLVTTFDIEGLGYFETGMHAIDPLYFPTGWQPGLGVDGFFTFPDFKDYVLFGLTEVTEIPLPGALPLFGFSLLAFARRKRG